MLACGINQGAVVSGSLDFGSWSASLVTPLCNFGSSLEEYFTGTLATVNDLFPDVSIVILCEKGGSVFCCFVPS